MYIQIESKSLSPEKESEYKNNIYSTLKTFHENYKTEQPLHFYVTSRFIHLKDFILHTGVYNIPFPPYEQQNIVQKSAKLFYFFIYLFVFIGGGISSLYFLIKNLKKDVFKFTFFSIPFYIIFLFPFVLKVHEFRFNTLSYPFLLVGACIAVIYFMGLIIKWSNEQKNRSTF